MNLTDELQTLLIRLAWDSIDYGLEKHKLLSLNLAQLPAELREKRATFVTLHRQGNLRGCIGAIDPVRALAEDVVHNAHASAFRDPRFSPLKRSEYSELDLAISILSLRDYLEFASEEELLQKIRPGIDGLVLEEGFHCGAFLPVMWEQLPTPKVFLQNLKRKAGLPMNHWSSEIAVSRFTAEYYLTSDGPAVKH